MVILTCIPQALWPHWPSSLKTQGGTNVNYNTKQEVEIASCPAGIPRGYGEEKGLQPASFPPFWPHSSFMDLNKLFLKPPSQNSTWWAGNDYTADTRKSDKVSTATSMSLNNDFSTSQLWVLHLGFMLRKTGKQHHLPSGGFWGLKEFIQTKYSAQHLAQNKYNTKLSLLLLLLVSCLREMYVNIL